MECISGATMFRILRQSDGMKLICIRVGKTLVMWCNWCRDHGSRYGIDNDTCAFGIWFNSTSGWAVVIQSKEKSAIVLEVKCCQS